MAYCALEKIKKKEKVKQYLKELRSMIPAELSKKRRFGTLSTLQHVLNSMRKLNGKLRLMSLLKCSLAVLSGTVTSYHKCHVNTLQYSTIHHLVLRCSA